jgi:histidinol-phosphate aminotransferase
MNRRNWLKINGLLAGSSLIHSTYANGTECSTPVDFPSEFLRMGSNENPYGPSKMTIQAIQDAAKMGNRYTDPSPLRQKLAEKFGVNQNNIILGAGSAEILGLTALAYFSQNKASLVAAKPTFFVLPNTVERLGSQVINVPLTTDKKHDLQKMVSAITTDTKMVYICNPNNPTGTKLDPSELRAFVEEISKDRIVAIDEVYHDFIQEPSMIPLVQNNKNIIIARSFSKVYGLAGMRIGFGVAHPETINHLSKYVAWAGNAISQVSLAAALAALNDQEFFKMSLQKNEESKQLLYTFLRDKKIDFIESHANCSVFSLDKFPKNFVSTLESEKKIIVRQIDDYGKLYCRISTGKPEDMMQFLAAVKGYI